MSSFSSGKIVTSMLVIQFLLLFGGLGVGNSSVINYFYTFTGDCADFSSPECDINIEFGTDKSKTGAENSIDGELDNLRNLGNPVEGNTNIFGSIFDGLRFIGGFIALMVTFGLGGITLIAYDYGLPFAFYIIIFPMQIMYIFALINIVQGGQF
jgi:hypothetical protein